MKINGPSIVKIYSIVFLVLFTFHSCSKDEKEQPLPKSMFVSNLDAIVLSHDRVKLKAEIKNFRFEDVVDCGFYFQQSSISCGIPSSGTFELAVSDLESLHLYSFTAYIKIKDQNGGEKEINDPSFKSFVTDFPIVEDFSPKVISDISSIALEGVGFNSKTYLYLVTKSSASGTQEEIKLFTETVNNEKYIASVPVLGARGKNFPALFEGAIQPCELYIGNLDRTLMKKIGNVTFRYRFSPMGNNVSPNGSFYIAVYYARESPPLEDIEVYFGDSKRDIINKTYGSISSPFNEIIEYYVLECKVPESVTAGSTHKIKIVSPFGEEFITFDDDEITVD